VVNNLTVAFSIKNETFSRSTQPHTHTQQTNAVMPLEVIKFEIISIMSHVEPTP
jgi:hypothetical protein